MPGKARFSTAHQILEVAESLLQNKMSFEEAYLRVSSFSTGRNTYTKTFYDVHCSFEAAYLALELIIHGTGKRDAEPNDPFGVGNDYFIECAVKAYTSIDKNPIGTWYDGIPIEYNLQKRLEFWEWWLTQAIPQAWELADVISTNFQPQ